MSLPYLIGLIILLVIIIFSAGEVYAFWNHPETKNKIEEAFRNSVLIKIPPDGHFITGIDHFNTGWDSAKKSPAGFFVWLGMSPVIFIFWILSKLFKVEIPEDFIKYFPPPHPGGRPTEKLDEEALKLFYSLESISKVWEVMKVEYIEQAINKAQNPDNARENLYDAFEITRLYQNFEKRLKRKIRQNYSK